ncbi:GNAT family N-acetyltransferase [bacterium]|nr:GNAT family N-acetyltransferase [bacterium]
MTDANFRFMARQLLLTELGGQLAGEESGLLLGHGPDIWVGISDIDAVGDAEEMVEACRGYAADTDGRLVGMILPYEPSEGKSQKIADLDEMMFLLDLPRREAGVPDNVQTMFSAGKHAAPSGLELRQADWQDAEVRAMMANGADAQEQLAGPALATHPGWPSLLECHTLSREGKVVAVAGTIATELSERLCYIVVDPQLRRQGIGRALVNKLTQAAHDQGRMLMNCWTQRSGKLRYFTSKSGFEDKLSMRWYMPPK